MLAASQFALIGSGGGNAKPVGTALLLHFDNDFSDSSGFNKTATPTNFSISSTAPKFGLGSASSAGSGKITFPNDASLQFGTGDFTIAMWLKVAAGTNAYNIFSNRNNDVSPIIGDYSLFLNGSSLNFYSRNTTPISVSDIFTRDDTFRHVALTKSGNTCRLFVDGILVGSGNSSNNFGDNANATGFWLGSQDAYLFTGSYDEVLVVKGAALWTASFTPPTAPYF